MVISYNKIISHASQNLNQTNPINTFTITKKNDLKKSCRKIGKAVYIFEQTGGSKKNAYDSLVKECVNMKLPPPNGNPSYIMYVGKVSTGYHNALYNRMRNHTENNSPKTGALRLNMWFDQFVAYSRYKITVFEFDRNTDSELLTLIEAAVWIKLRPAFGTLGKRSASKAGSRRFKLLTTPLVNNQSPTQSQVILNTLQALGNTATQDEIISSLEENGLETEQTPKQVFNNNLQKLISNGDIIAL